MNSFKRWKKYQPWLSPGLTFFHQGINILYHPPVHVVFIYYSPETKFKGDILVSSYDCLVDCQKVSRLEYLHNVCGLQ